MSSSTTQPSPSPSAGRVLGVLTPPDAGRAAGVVGAAGLLAACGGDDDDTRSGSGDTAAATGTRLPRPAIRPRPAAPARGATGTVTFGSNYSDRRTGRLEAMMAAFAQRGIDVTINTIDHNTYQENITTYIQQPDDVLSLVRRLPHALLREQGCRRRHLRRVGKPRPTSARASRAPRPASTASSTSCRSTSTHGPCTTGRACSRRTATPSRRPGTSSRRSATRCRPTA